MLTGPWQAQGRAKDPAAELANTMEARNKLMVIAVVAGHFLKTWLRGCEKTAHHLETACTALVYGDQFACVLERAARNKEDRCKASVSACCVKQGCVYAQRIIVYLPN